MSSGGLSVCFDEIEGVLSVAFKLPGFTVDSSEFCFLVFGPVVWSTSDELDSLGVEGLASSGKGKSSREKIERSSPFHWSPSECLFCRSLEKSGEQNSGYLPRTYRAKECILP